jgi:uncharacterized protein YecT (DUF1311 family)
MKALLKPTSTVARRIPLRLEGALVLVSLLIASSHSTAAAPQQNNAGPSFRCELATTGVEKLICTDRDLSALDLEYSRAYEQELLRTTDKNQAESLKSNAKFFLESRSRCANDSLDSAFRLSAIGCIADWYYWRIAELSVLPAPPPIEWSPRWIGGIGILTDRSRGLPQTRALKPLPTAYFKPHGSAQFSRWDEAFDGPAPANMGETGVYFVYANVLGNLTYVKRYNDEHLDESYFFNKDGRLAAQQRRFDMKLGGKNYAQFDTVYFGSNGKEARHIQYAWLDGNYTSIVKAAEPSRLDKPAFNSLNGLYAIFRNSERVDADRLGMCIIDLGDGYGSTARILNLQAEPLDAYRRSLPPMNLKTFDNTDAVRGKTEGTSELLGTLSGKQVYVVRYPDGLIGVLVERQRDRFLPVLYVKPELQVDRLGIKKMGNEDVLEYSTTESGTGHFTLDWYFIIENGVPRSIHYDTVLSEELKRILPEKYGVWKGGGFNSDTLVFSHSVWKDTDGNCCPSGGSVEVVLGLEKGRFFVKSSHYFKPE